MKGKEVSVYVNKGAWKERRWVCIGKKGAWKEREEDCRDRKVMDTINGEIKIKEVG